MPSSPTVEAALKRMNKRVTVGINIQVLEMLRWSGMPDQTKRGMQPALSVLTPTSSTSRGTHAPNVRTITKAVIPARVATAPSATIITLEILVLADVSRVVGLTVACVRPAPTVSARAASNATACFSGGALKACGVEFNLLLNY